jgi:hypothetical protein
MTKTVHRLTEDGEVYEHRLTEAEIEAKAKRWRASFVEERMATAEVAVRFLAECYSDPGQDIITLVYSRKLRRFTVHHGPGNVEVLDDDALIAEIKDWMEAQRPWANRDCLFVHAECVLHMLVGIVAPWADHCDTWGAE